MLAIVVHAGTRPGRIACFSVPFLTHAMSTYPTLADTAARLDSGAATSLALTEQALERCAQGEGPRTFTRTLAATALAEARASDLLRAAGLARSPLEGLPISVKDLFDVAGHATLAGSRLLQGNAPASQDAHIVQRLRRAGAVIVGTTNMTEFAFSGIGLNPHYGTPRNPWGREAGGGGRIPGGSSSGAAVSVTDAMALAAIGSDTGGSVRIPAALCGLTGFKPTQRRVPTAGALPLSTTLDSVGPLAASVACCALLDAVLADAPLTPLTAAPLAGLRLLAPTNVVLDGMDDAVAVAWERALSRLSQAGVRIHQARVAPLQDLAQINALGSFSNAEAWAWHRPHLQQHERDYDPRVLSRILRGRSMGAADYVDLLRLRRQWQQAMAGQLQGHDLLVMPTVPVVAPRIADLEASDEAFFAANAAILRNPSMVNFLDGCAVSLPIHQPGDAPVGLSLAGLGGQDALLLSAALAVQAALG